MSGIGQNRLNVKIVKPGDCGRKMMALKLCESQEERLVLQLFNSEHV